MERRFGWDTHGLPAELEAMKQLGMTDKMQIEAMGIDKFNDACRASVMKYADEWQSYVTRQARWVDFENDYKTLNVEYMESVIWAFKQLHDKGLTYKGFRVLPYCWKDETPLSNHELRMDDDVYKNRQDQTVTVTFPFSPGSRRSPKQLAGVQALAWTTTPWTLPTNLALAVGPDVIYAVLPAGPNGVKAPRGRAAPAVSCSPRTCWAPTPRTWATPMPPPPQAAITTTYTGKDLAGIAYAPLWDNFTDTEKSAPRTPGAAGRRLRHHHRRHRHRPPGPRLRRGRPEGLRGSRHPGDPLRRRGRQVPAAVHHGELAGDRRRAGVRRQQGHHQRAARTRDAWSARPATSTATRTAGAAAPR